MKHDRKVINILSINIQSIFNKLGPQTSTLYKATGLTRVMNNYNLNGISWKCNWKHYLSKVDKVAYPQRTLGGTTNLMENLGHEKSTPKYI